MGELKLSIEDVKYCVEEFKPDGFYNTPYGEAVKQIARRGKAITETQEVLQQHFLTRVIEGINIKAPNDYQIVIDSHIMITYSWGIPLGGFSAVKTTDKGKIKAIKYIIDQLRK